RPMISATNTLGQRARKKPRVSPLAPRLNSSGQKPNGIPNIGKAIGTGSAIHAEIAIRRLRMGSGVVETIDTKTQRTNASDITTAVAREPNSIWITRQKEGPN